MASNPDSKKVMRKFAMPLFFAVIFMLVIISIVLLVSQFSYSIEEIEITRASCPNNLYECYQMFQIWQYSLNQRVFEWNLSSGKIIFWISMAITVSGLAFCCWQFWDASSIARQSEDAEIQVKTEAFSLALKSKSIGVLVLFVSIVYLAIYAKLIYPIEVIDVLSKQTTSRTSRYVDVQKDRVENTDEDAKRLSTDE